MPPYRKSKRGEGAVADIREVNRKLAWASILVLIAIMSIIVDRLTGCSRQVKEKVVTVTPIPTAAPTAEPPPVQNPGDELLALDEIEQSILEDISRPELNQADRENYRYLVLSDLHNEGSKVDFGAQGINKAVNQVSSERFLKMSVPVDKERSIYRIDLRDYFGSKGKEVWKRIEKDVPIKIVSKTIRGQTLQFLTQAVEPWMHGRLFTETALTNETYYDIVGVPSTLAAYYKNVAGVIPQNDFDARDPGAFLIGTHRSQISENDRLVWRLEGKDGAVWQTFDVDNNNIGAQENLLQNPFVAEVNPVGRLVTNKIFKHVASETIGALPNGMAVYALWDAQGVRQNAAPQTVVTNTRAVGLGLVSEIRNARDCTGCHQSGFIAVTDQIGPHIKGSSEFNAQEKQLGELFFKKQATTDAFMAQDNSVYTGALKDLNIAAGPDPINEGLLDSVRSGMDVTEVAAFFFLDDEEFIEALRGSENVQGEIGTLIRGGEISFQQFINSAPQIIADLNLFIDVE